MQLHSRVTCPGTRPGVAGNLWGRARCARHTRVGWRHVRTTSALAHAAARAVTERQLAVHNLLEGLRGGGGRHSVTEATGLLLQAVGAGVCWTDAVEALVDVDESQRLVNLQGAAVPVPAFASFPASVVMCGEPAPVVVVLHQVRVVCQTRRHCVVRLTPYVLLLRGTALRPPTKRLPAVHRAVTSRMCCHSARSARHAATRTAPPTGCIEPAGPDKSHQSCASTCAHGLDRAAAVGCSAP
jgi:hypothetical protein